MTEGIQGKENKAEQFKYRLDAILERPITVETIDSYMDRSVDELVELTDAVVTDYRENNSTTTLTGNALEDAAYQENKLTNIGEFLDTAQQKAEQLNHIDRYIDTYIITKSDVITPPDAWEGFRGKNGTYEHPDIKHRLKTLLYILVSHKIDLGSVIAKDGIMPDAMLRNTSYVSITVPELNRLALVCDEEGNASYIFDLTKMNDASVSIDDVEQMSKEQRNAFIDQHPGVGVRFNYSSAWVGRTEDFLFNPLPEQKESEPNPIDQRRSNPDLDGLPKASAKELDPWKGFWTDEQGKHWAPITLLSEQMGVKRIVTDALVKRETFATKKIVGISGRGVDAFCYEDMAAHEHVKDLLAAPGVETEGEWKGFYTDEKGKHWAGKTETAEKLGISRTFLNKYYDGVFFPFKKVKPAMGHVSDAVCYEDLVAHTEVKEFLAAPRVEAEGEWKGFWTDSAGNHWAGMPTLVTRIDMERDGLSKIIENGSFATKMIKPISGPVMDAFCIETLLQDERLKKILAAPRVEKEGEWKGFYIDEQGKHWTSKWNLTERIDLSHPILSKILAAHTNEMTIKDARDFSDRLTSTYCYEDIMQLPEVTTLIALPKVEQEGEWKGFWKGEDGKHYGTVRQIALREKRDRDAFERIIREKNIQHIDLRDGSGKKSKGYAYEDFA